MAIYYVSNTGLDTNSGLTEALPFKTCNKINSLTLDAGDKILFKYGDEWIGDSLVIDQQDGTIGAFIEFDAYGDSTLAKPHITNLAPVCWMHQNRLGGGLTTLAGRSDPTFDQPTGTPWTSTFTYAQVWNKNSPNVGTEGTDWYRGPSTNVPTALGGVGYSTCLVNHVGINNNVTRVGWATPNNSLTTEYWSILGTNPVSTVLSTILVSGTHDFVVGETVDLQGITFSSKDPNGQHVVTNVISGSQFQIAFDLVGETLNTGYACSMYTVSGYLMKSRVDPTTGSNVPTFSDTNLALVAVSSTNVTESVNTASTWVIDDRGPIFTSDDNDSEDVWYYYEKTFSCYNTITSAPEVNFEITATNAGKGVGYIDHLWFDRAIKHLDHASSTGEPIFYAMHADYVEFQETGAFMLGHNYLQDNIVNPDGTQSTYLSSQFSTKSSPHAGLTMTSNTPNSNGWNQYDINELYKDKTSFYDQNADVIVYRFDARDPIGAKIAITERVVSILDSSFLRIKNLRFSGYLKRHNSSSPQYVVVDIEGRIAPYTNVEIIDCDIEYGSHQTIKFRWPGMIESGNGTPLAVTGDCPGLVLRGCTFNNSFEGSLGFHGAGIVEDCTFTDVATSRFAKGDASVMNVDNQQDNATTADTTRLAGPLTFRNNSIVNCGRVQDEFTATDISFVNGAGSADSITTAGSVDFTQYFQRYDRLYISSPLNSYLAEESPIVWSVTPTTITIKHGWVTGNDFTTESNVTATLSTVYFQRSVRGFSSDISVDGAAKTITTAGYLDFTDYFSNGDSILLMSDSMTNDTGLNSANKKLISTVTASVITLDAGETLTTENAATIGEVVLIKDGTMYLYQDQCLSWDNGLTENFNVYNNRFENIGVGVLSMNCGAANSNIYNNIFWNCVGSYGPTGVRSGTVTNNGSVLRIGQSNSALWEPGTNIKIFNNVFGEGKMRGNGANAAAISFYDSDMSGLEIKNNIFYNMETLGFTFHSTWTTDGMSTALIDANILYGGNYLFSIPGGSWGDTTLEDFKAEVYVGDNNTYYDDPLINVNDDYYPVLNSPCVAAGIWIPRTLDWGNKPFKRSNPSIGIWELAGNRDFTNREQR